MNKLMNPNPGTIRCLDCKRCFVDLFKCYPESDDCKPEYDLTYEDIYYYRSDDCNFYEEKEKTNEIR